MNNNIGLSTEKHVDGYGRSVAAPKSPEAFDKDVWGLDAAGMDRVIYFAQFRIGKAGWTIAERPYDHINWAFMRGNPSQANEFWVFGPDDPEGKHLPFSIHLTYLNALAEIIVHV